MTKSFTILIAEEHDRTRVPRRQPDRRRLPGARASDRARRWRCSSQRTGLIVVDVNGHTLELLDAVRSGDGLAGHVDPDTPLIVLTRDPTGFSGSGCSSAGETTSCSKPFAYPELRARIGALLRRCRARACAQCCAPARSRSTSARARCGCRPPVELPAKEYELLVTLAASRRGCSRARSCCAPCGVSDVRTHAHARQPRRRLRRKLVGSPRQARRQRVGGRLPARC